MTPGKCVDTLRGKKFWGGNLDELRDKSVKRMNVIPAFHKWDEGELFIHLHTYLLSVDMFQALF